MTEPVTLSVLALRAIFWGRPCYRDAAFNAAVKIRFGIVPNEGDDPHDGVLAVLHVAVHSDAQRLYSVLNASGSRLTVVRAYLVDVTARPGKVLSQTPIDSTLERLDSLMAVFQ